MKKFLKRGLPVLAAVCLLVCGQVCSAVGATQLITDFSDRDYLLPIDFSILDNRALEDNLPKTDIRTAPSASLSAAAGTKTAVITGPWI